MNGSWQRLDSRVLWVDTVRALLSLIPGGLAVFVFDQQISGFAIGSALFATTAGVFGAVTDFLRWFKTRYRITDDHIEVRTGLVFRGHRTIRRELIRSVDARAKLRHRLAGLRILRVEAGQQSIGESALSLDAVSRDTAEHLRIQLLHHPPTRTAPTPATNSADPTPDLNPPKTRPMADGNAPEPATAADGDPAESVPAADTKTVTDAGTQQAGVGGHDGEIPAMDRSVGDGDAAAADTGQLITQDAVELA
ncbi:MAG: PH domain-containing protein, partial [Stackebrandtia sp.]